MARSFALVFGIVYLLVGLMGFIPQFLGAYTGPDLVVDAGRGNELGIFPINVLHNIVHILIGIWGLASYRSLTGSVAYARGLAIIYALLAVMGLIPGFKTTFGLIPIHGADVGLHALTALIAAYFGWSTTRTTDLSR